MPVRKRQSISPSEKVNEILVACGTTPIQTGTKLIDLIRRPQLNYEVLTEVDSERPDYPKAVFEGAEIEMKYDGYIKRQKADIEEMRRLEQKVLPKDVNYHELVGLRKEAQEKLQQVKPANIGQAYSYFRCQSRRYICFADLVKQIIILYRR